ncbi:MAG TPA: hypothetical protein VM143_02340 [Acidimicrobiales bacterium]|nr:hypothetical protein [Acidimicrobiales bacterium]
MIDRQRAHGEAPAFGRRPRVLARKGDSGRAALLAMQRSAGNAAVAGVLQRAFNPNPDDRRLTSTEKGAAQLVFGTALDVDPVILSFNRTWTVGGYARTIHNTINVPPPDIDLPLLIHELTHVWQYQRGANVPGMMWEAIAGRYLPKKKDERDALVEKFWADGLAFDELATEAQADIVQYYYEGSRTGAYLKYVEDLRSGKEKVHRYQTVTPVPGATLDWVDGYRKHSAATETKIVKQLKRAIAPTDGKGLADRRRRLLWLFYSVSGYESSWFRDRISEARSNDEMVRLLNERISAGLRAELTAALLGKRPRGKRPEE